MSEGWALLAVVVGTVVLALATLAVIGVIDSPQLRQAGTVLVVVAVSAGIVGLVKNLGGGD